MNEIEMIEEKEKQIKTKKRRRNKKKSNLILSRKMVKKERKKEINDSELSVKTSMIELGSCKM